MSTSNARIGDSIQTRSRYGRPTENTARITGHGTYRLIGADGTVKQEGAFTNLITRIGDQMYGERGAGIGTLGAPTGMRYGTGSTAVAKTGAGAAIVTYVSGSSQVFDSAAASSLSGSSRRITYTTTWAAGTATATGISEVVITNITIADVAGAEANTISRALIDPVVNKGAGDSLEIVWNHDLLGA
jgi:hypothetical protein